MLRKAGRHYEEKALQCQRKLRELGCNATSADPGYETPPKLTGKKDQSPDEHNNGKQAHGGVRQKLRDEDSRSAVCL
jgi:hypothetical protein